MGLSLFPWQRDVLWDLCARDGADRPSYVTAGLSVPRQNGKNAILEAYELYLLTACAAHILHTAHRVKTAKKSFTRLVRYFTDKRHPDVLALVANIRYTNGEEAIYLTNGGSIEFSARSRAGNRGFDDIQLVVLDEAQDLTDEQLNAIMFTLAASSTGDRQMVLTGTPPDESAPGTVFRRTREAALAGADDRFMWKEWGVEELPPRSATFEDLVEAVYASNPSMGYVLDLDFTRHEFAKADTAGFARERLGWWSATVAACLAIGAELWEASGIPEIGGAYRGRRALAVKFSPDGSSWALAGCKLKGRGRKDAAVELIRSGGTEDGTRSLAVYVWRRRKEYSCVVVDGMGQADALIDNLDVLKCPRGFVVRPRAGEVAASAQLMVDGLRDGSLVHSTEGQEAMAASARGCVRRAIGTRGGWGFGSTDACDATPVAAGGLAVWGAKTCKRDPKRKQRLV